MDNSLTAAPGKPTVALKVAHWILTVLFSAMMAMAAYGYLTAPAMAAAFTHLGYPQYFRVELAIAKILGVLALLLPVPARLKEWAYAGFTITVISAGIAHYNVDGPGKLLTPAIAIVLLAGSYICYSLKPRTAQS